MNPRIKMKEQDLARIMQVCGPAHSGEDGREVLQKIELRAEDGKCTATALNGFVVAQTTVDCSGEGVFLMPYLKPGELPHSDGDVVIEQSDYRQQIIFADDTAVTQRKCETDFVDWEKACVGKARRKPMYQMMINADYLRTALNCIEGGEVLLEFHAPDDPLVIRGRRSAALALPMRYTGANVDRRFYRFAKRTAEPELVSGEVLNADLHGLLTTINQSPGLTKEAYDTVKKHLCEIAALLQKTPKEDEKNEHAGE